MVFRSETEAAAHAADVIAAGRNTCVSIQLTSCPESMERFVSLLFECHPELIACIDTLSVRTEFLGAWNELIFDVTYTEIMASSVLVLNQLDTVSKIMLRDVKLHRRYTVMVFPNGLEASVKKAVSQITEMPQFLDCFIKGTAVNIKRRTGFDYFAISVKYMYSCSYSDYRLRTNQMKRAIDEIVQSSRMAGLEDWKKAFSVVKYCVDNWKYGSVDEMPGAEFYSYGALVNHTAVCMGISLAVCAVFSELGIPCRYIKGMRNGEGHAWNMVFLRGGWFFIDVTDAIGQHDPLHHWGMISCEDRIITDTINVPIKCTCPVSFLLRNGVI